MILGGVAGALTILRRIEACGESVSICVCCILMKEAKKICHLAVTLNNRRLRLDDWVSTEPLKIAI